MAKQKQSNAPAKTAPRNSERPILAWETKEFEEYDRNKKWYAVALVAGVLLVAGALVLQQWLVAVVFALATYVVVQHAGDKPRTLAIAISKLGVQVGKRFHPFSELKAFWVIYKPPAKTLTLQGISRFKPLIKVHLADVDPLAVQNALKDHLAEQAKESEDFIDKLSRWIRL
ncbi:MAG: hypothetical protein Q8Q11_00425 [bacterium]|nr:hypothetical protein [bacterium]MDZ4247815.1 hypothetical protein [Patescibacteria group bacterium]